MIKLVASDLDGTLLDGAHQLSKRTIRSIHNLQKAGIMFIAATGRDYKSVAPMFQKENIDCDCILLNGALVCDAHGKQLMQMPMEQNVLASFACLLEESGLPYNLYTAQGIICSKAELGRKAFIDHMKAHGMREEEVYKMMEMTTFGTYDREIKDIACFLKEQPQVYKAEVYGTDPERLSALRKQLYDVPSIAVTNSVADNIEVTAFDAQKGNALAAYCKQRGITTEEVLVFGDSRNDLSMIQKCKHSVAVENAASIIKEAAAYQTLSNANDGVAYVLEQLVRRYVEKRVSNF